MTTLSAAAPFAVPFARNPLFIGRAGDLAQLARRLAPARAAVVVCGVGGLGKTQLAVEYAYQAWETGAYPGGIFWLRMDDPATIAAQVADLAGPPGLALPSYDPAQPTANCAAVRAAWAALVARLLIFDNLDLDDPEAAAALLQAWRPHVGGSRVLVTSRNAEWPARLGLDVAPLPLLTRPHSREVLLESRARRLGHPVAALLADPTTAAEAEALAAWLGDLPLALGLAGAYLEAYPRVSLATYRAELETTALAHPSLDAPAPADAVLEHDASVAVTFLRSYGRLDERTARDALALRLLHRAACCAPGAPIPERLALRAAGLDPDAPTSQTQAAVAVRRLTSLGLVAQDPASGLLTLHRLVAAFVRAHAPDPGGDAGAVEAALVAEVHVINAHRNPLPGAPYVVHLHHAAAAVGARTDPGAAALLTELGGLLYYRGEYGAAHGLLERGRRIREQVLGPTHLDTTISLSWLAYSFKEQGDYSAARALFERVLAIRKEVLGLAHPDTIRSLNNLGGLLRDQGDYATARPLYEQALVMSEQTLGPTHPATARSLNNLALVLAAQGDYATARPLVERALTIYEQARGPVHPETAGSLNDLARMLTEHGDYAAARPLAERALMIAEQVLGPDHPRTRRYREDWATLQRTLEEP
jgi:hypothetical protein